jgi:sec-independent protein translocase protein TatB
MFFDMSPLEIVVLIGLGIVLFGPDKLPGAAQQAARFIRQVRAFGESARNDLRNELGPEFDGLKLDDLNPKTFVRKNLLGEMEELRGLRDELNRQLREPLAGELPAARSAAAPTLAAGERPPYDDDAT